MRVATFDQRTHRSNWIFSKQSRASDSRRAHGLPVLAGSLMGGEIELAVREVRKQGLLVISLNMAGSVPDAADLVVSLLCVFVLERSGNCESRTHGQATGLIWMDQIR